MLCTCLRVALNTGPLVVYFRNKRDDFQLPKEHGFPVSNKYNLPQIGIHNNWRRGWDVTMVLRSSSVWSTYSVDKDYLRLGYSVRQWDSVSF